MNRALDKLLNFIPFSSPTKMTQDLMPIKYKKNRKNIKNLTKTEKSYIFYSPTDYELEKKSKKLLGTEISMAIPDGYYGQLYSNYRYLLGGVIDSDYRGEIKAIIYNDEEITIKIKEGEELCRILFIKTLESQLEDVNELDESVRGESGFGSTGQ